MGLEDFVTKGKALYTQNQDKIDAALKSERAEQISDKLLDGAAGGADKLSAGKYAEQIAKARERADKSIGTE
ncbi:MAG: hypothetical protein NT132_03950 [Microbacterium sp.]|uniref:hypothetical protein n=1 Tax=Microbacterium sp. TaxID=51671 RepID=UPI002627F992|nr:hypothetical protein [Microbacterium sp.]MCX6501552.1 hypothetical protein [Microbacterium sp.]